MKHLYIYNDTINLSFMIPIINEDTIVYEDYRIYLDSLDGNKDIKIFITYKHVIKLFNIYSSEIQSNNSNKLNSHLHELITTIMHKIGYKLSKIRSKIIIYNMDSISFDILELLTPEEMKNIQTLVFNYNKFMNPNKSRGLNNGIYDNAIYK